MARLTDPDGNWLELTPASDGRQPEGARQQIAPLHIRLAAATADGAWAIELPRLSGAACRELAAWLRAAGDPRQPPPAAFGDAPAGPLCLAADRHRGRVVLRVTVRQVSVPAQEQPTLQTLPLRATLHLRLQDLRTFEAAYRRELQTLGLDGEA